MARLIEAIASLPHYADHLAPVHLALGDDAGAFWTTDDATASRVASYGIEARPLPPRALLGRRNRRTAPPALVASSADAGIARRHHFGYLVRMEHGAGQSYAGIQHPAYAGGTGQRDVALFLCPNDHSARRWRAAYPRADVEVIGSPFAETLPPPDPGAHRVGITFHWTGRLWPELRSALPHYAPALADLARAYPVLGHHHPRADDVGAAYAEAGIEVETDYRAWLAASAVVIGDNTSALYEAALTRPVVVLDAPWYRRTVEHGLRFWQAADVGVRISDPADLIDAVAVALADPPRLARGRDTALSAVYAHRTGAAQRAAAVIRTTGR